MDTRGVAGTRGNTLRSRVCSSTPSRGALGRDRPKSRRLFKTSTSKESWEGELGSELGASGFLAVG